MNKSLSILHIPSYFQPEFLTNRVKSLYSQHHLTIVKYSEINSLLFPMDNTKQKVDLPQKSFDVVHATSGASLIYALLKEQRLLSNKLIIYDSAPFFYCYNQAYTYFKINKFTNHMPNLATYSLKSFHKLNNINIDQANERLLRTYINDDAGKCVIFGNKDPYLLHNNVDNTLKQMNHIDIHRFNSKNHNTHIVKEPQYHEIIYNFLQNSL